MVCAYITTYNLIFSTREDPNSVHHVVTCRRIATTSGSQVLYLSGQPADASGFSDGHCVFWHHLRRVTNYKRITSLTDCLIKIDYYVLLNVLLPVIVLSTKRK